MKQQIQLFIFKTVIVMYGEILLIQTQEYIKTLLQTLMVVIQF